MAGGVVMSRQTAEHYTWGGGNCDGWHFLKSQDLSVILERVPPGGSEVKHYHRKSHQFFFVLSGRATLELDGQKLTISSHQGCSVAPGVAHRLSNPAGEKEDLVFLVVSSPMSHGDRVVLEEGEGEKQAP